jgi:hypothetical protein
LEGYSFEPLASGEPDLPAELRAEEEAGSQLAILQFRGPIQQQWRDQIEALGVMTHEYIPDFAYLVTLDGAQRELLADLSFVRWIGTYHPAYKISTQIGKTELVDPGRIDDPQKTLILLLSGDAASARDRVEELGFEVVEAVQGWSPRLFVKAPPEAIPDLARLPQVWWIEEKPDFILLNNTTRWVIQSNTSPQTPIWDQGLHGEDEIVAMMDSGLDYNSCWFRDTGNAPPNANHRKVINYKTWGGGNAYDGCSTGHGTHVAGTCVGDQSFINPGNFNYNGMAYAAKIAVQDVGGDGFFECLLGLISPPGSLTAAFNDAYNLGARVHTNSWGSTSSSYDSYARDVDNFMWGHPDFLACYAMGNSGPGGGTIGSPATAKDCMSVGSTRQAPQQNTVASYSSRGPTSDGRRKPTVMAPGGESPTYIFSANNHNGNPPSPTCQSQGSPFQGTSMATPAVAGAAMLARQYYREGWYPSGGPVPADGFVPSAALIKATLVNTAIDMGTPDIPNNNEGWGRLLLDDAFYFTGDARKLQVEDETVGLATGEQDVYTYQVDSSSEPLEIILAWTDYPAATGGGVKLVNDLDLTVEAPGGVVYKGNVFAGGQSVSGGSFDKLNVVEGVRLNSPPTGTYTIRVGGFNVPQGPRQPYGLVSTGAFEQSSSATDVAGVSRSTVLESHPNPFGHGIRISYRIPGSAVGSPLRLEVFDVSGRRLRVLAEGHATEAGGVLHWDGRDGAGRELPGGIYFAVLRVRGERVREKLVRLR